MKKCPIVVLCFMPADGGVLIIVSLEKSRESRETCLSSSKFMPAPFVSILQRHIAAILQADFCVL